ncbi:MAG: glycerophosphodiester phosphodiesterase [Actinobacteria bacterium]|nr:glycerophosphodiester phosphodiesterase [Actinomycetota bacterium]
MTRTDLPLGFAHRGARAHAPDNTLRGFRLALEMGARGIETDVWMTSDAVPVLHHGGALRRRPIGTLRADQTGLPRLADLYDACGTHLDLSLDLKDGRSAGAVLEVARAAGHDPSRLWLCGWGLGPLRWRSVDPDVRLVSDTRKQHLADGWPAHLRSVREGGGTAINLRRRRWTKALVDLVHEAGLLAFGWDAQSERRIRALLALGCDAVYSDHVDRMVRVLGRPAG